MTDIAPTTSNGMLTHLGHVLRENPVTALSFGLFAFFVLQAFFGHWLVPYDPLATNSVRALEAPSADHWFGTDQLGRDVFSRTIMATRLDLTISVLAVGISFIIGSILGALAGYWGGWLDAVLNRILDTIMAFPLFVLAMGIVAALGNTVENIIYATAIINIPFYARVVRAEVNIRREAGFAL
ncbi:MAG: ABC transporter permease, partial [Loktanella sp.]|nr:ABC transporter permease [Loktanella sp.]